jgi:hypothetical protein
MIKEFKAEEAQIGDPIRLDTLTLEKNSVLIARVPNDGFYDAEMLQCLHKGLQNKFPCHSVFVWYNDVDFMVIHDKGYKSERITCNDDDSSNYY